MKDAEPRQDMPAYAKMERAKMADLQTLLPDLRKMQHAANWEVGSSTCDEPKLEETIMLRLCLWFALTGGVFIIATAVAVFILPPLIYYIGSIIRDSY